jgi:hypothetical protein
MKAVEQGIGGRKPGDSIKSIARMMELSAGQWYLLKMTLIMS